MMLVVLCNGDSDSGASQHIQYILEKHWFFCGCSCSAAIGTCHVACANLISCVTF